MKKFISIIGSLSFVFAFTFEGLTNLGANWEANRANMEARITLNQTAPDGLNEKARDENVKAIDAYTYTLERGYEVYDCSVENPCR